MECNRQLNAGSIDRVYFHSAGYARPPLSVPADMLSAVKKCPNLFMLWGYVIPSPQAVAGRVLIRRFKDIIYL